MGHNMNIETIDNFWFSSNKGAEDVSTIDHDGKVHKEKELAGLDKSGPDLNPVSTPTTAPRPKISKLTAARLSAAAKAAKANKIREHRTSEVKGPKLCAHKNNPGLKF